MSSVTINGNTYNVANFNGYGYIDNIFNLAADQVVVAGESASSAELSEEWATKTYNSTVTGGGGEFSAKHYSTQASYWANTAEDSTVPGGGGEFSSKHYSAKSDASAQEALGYRNTTLTYRNESETFKNQAQAAAAAADKGIPFVTTTGTGSAYVADYSPSVTLADGVMFALDLHTGAASTTPTVNVNSAGAKTMVIGYDRRPVDTGIVISGVNVLCTYDGENDEVAIIGGLPLFEFNRNIDANGNTINNVELTNVTMISGSISPAVTGLNNITRVATGSITAGDMVALNSDATVSAISNSSVPQAIGSSVDAGDNSDSGAGRRVSAYDSVNDKEITVWIDAGGNLEMEVATISGTIPTFSGTITQLEATGCVTVDICFHAIEEVFVVVYGNATALKAIAVDVSGVTPSLGSAITVDSIGAAKATRVKCVYDSTYEKVIANYVSDEATPAVYLKNITASGTTLTSAGSASQIGTNPSNGNIGFCYEAQADKCVSIYYDTGNSELRAYVGQSNGDNMLVSKEQVIDYGESGGPSNLTLFYDSVKKKLGLVLIDLNASDQVYGLVGQVSQFGVGFGPATSFSNGSTMTGTDLDSTYDPISGKVAVVAHSIDSADTTATQLLIGKINGDVLGFETSFTTIDAADTYPHISTFKDGKVFYVPLTLECRVIQLAYDNSNADDYLGIAQATVTNGQNVTVALPSAVDDNQSGLAGGSKYYIDVDGSLTLTNTGRYAGRALAADTLLLEH